MTDMWCVGGTHDWWGRVQHSTRGKRAIQLPVAGWERLGITRRE